MEELLRALHRRWLANPGDIDAANAFMAAYTRLVAQTAYEPNPLDEILLDLLCAHVDEEGVDSFTNNATVKLIRLLFGEDHVREYLRIIEGQDTRWYFDEPGADEINDLDRLIASMPLRCGHQPLCDKNDPKCEVKGCLCPGCFALGERSICYHHHELIQNDLGHFMSNFSLIPPLG